MRQQQHPAGRVFSLSALAQLLGRHRNTVAAWLERGCPAVEPPDREAGRAGALDLAAVVEWLEAEAARRGAARAEAELVRLRALAAVPSDVSEEEGRRRKRVAEAALLELDLAERRGESIPRGDFEEIVISLASAVVLRLGAIPSKAAGEARQAGSDAEAEALLRQFIDQACEELADLGAKLQADLEREARGGR